MKSASVIASISLLVSSAAAHSIFQVRLPSFSCISFFELNLLPGQELWVNGVSQGHINGIRVPDYDGVNPLSQSE